MFLLVFLLMFLLISLLMLLLMSLPFLAKLLSCMSLLTISLMVLGRFWNLLLSCKLLKLMMLPDPC
jgi:hypothetical protein